VQKTLVGHDMREFMLKIESPVMSTPLAGWRREI